MTQTNRFAVATIAGHISKDKVYEFTPRKNSFISRRKQLAVGKALKAWRTEAAPEVL
ncbi:MAG: hypothetical protein M4579_007500, partial [Chaenotheca gracillima]